MRVSIAAFVAFCVVVAAQSRASFTSSGAPPPLRAREVFKELVEINTTDTPAGDVTKAAEAVATRLRAAGFGDDLKVLGPDPRKHNVVARLRGTGRRKPLLLVAHLDVVEARREDWTMDPFKLLEKDGYFYGRGTSDDKAMASAFVTDLIRLKQEGYRPDRDLVLALTADEEGGSFNGVEWLLRQHRELIDAQMAINEGGSGQMRGGKNILNEIQASEKVYQDFRLETRSPGGHSSRPIRDNAIYHLSAALEHLSRFDFPLNLNQVTRTYFARMAGLQTDSRLAADMRAVAASSPDRLAATRLSSSSYFNALMRTTCVATRLESGHANNALPQLAAANVNCRILPEESPATVQATLERVLADPQISVSPVDKAVSSPSSPLDSSIMAPVESVTNAMWPGVVVVPVMSTGATDGVFLRSAGIPTYGVEGFFYEIDDNRAHGKDERVGVKQFYEGVEFQYRLIKALAGTD